MTDYISIRAAEYNQISLKGLPGKAGADRFIGENGLQAAEAHSREIRGQLVAGYQIATADHISGLKCFQARETISKHES